MALAVCASREDCEERQAPSPHAGEHDGVIFWSLIVLGMAGLGVLIVRATRSDRALLLLCLVTLGLGLFGAAVGAMQVSPG